MFNKESIRRVIAEELGVNISEVFPEASLRADLGADSMDILSLLIMLETEFSVDLPDSEANKICTVQDAIDCIARFS